MKESQVQAQVVALFKSVGAYVHPTSQYRKSRIPPGLPDLIILLPRGKGVVFFEVKALFGKMSEEQLAFMGACEMAEEPYWCGGVEEARLCLRMAGLLA